MEIGELYKELRIARGLRQKDVARGNLSASQLSKFETGRSMLTADKLLLAIEGIHMTFSEFGHALNNYQEPPLFKMSQQLTALQAQQDIQGLVEILDTYGSYENFDVYNRLNQLIIKVIIHTVDNDYPISDEDKEFLTHYLYEIEEWTEYELTLFGNTMIILSEADLVFLGKAFIERSELYIAIPSNKKSAQLVLLNLILILTERANYYQAAYFMTCLEKLLIYQDMFATVYLNFLKLLIDYLEGKLNDRPRIEHYIEMVEELGNPTLAMFMRDNLEQLAPLDK